MSSEKPLNLTPVGVTYTGEGVSGDKSEVVRKQISLAANLTDLCDEYCFYTPALLHTGLKLGNQDPYTDFLNQHSCDISRISLRFSRPVFRGLLVGSNAEWNHVLYGLQKDYWDLFLQFMGSLAFVDRDTKIVSRVRTQVLQIPDPLLLERSAVLPTNCLTTEITAFVLDTSAGCYYFKVGTAPLLEPPIATRTERCFSDTLIFADELSRSDNPNPYGRIDEAAGEDVILAELFSRVKKERESNEQG